MAVENHLPELLDTLTQSIYSTLEATPDNSSIFSPKNGISLLDVKNDLLLSYLQNLVFLILLKLRQHNFEGETPKHGNPDEDAVVKKLVELRVYLEKGVRPLEGRLKYQIDKVLRAADDMARKSASATDQTVTKSKSVVQNGAEGSVVSDDSEPESVTGVTLNAREIDDLQYRPQPSSMTRPAFPSELDSTRSDRNGFYRPPRITATAMPTTRPQEKGSRKPNKSATMDEFISTELSSAPMAEPSIGSTIVSGGRRSKSDREKKDDAERQEYEEKNYVRLPKESKKDRAKKGTRRDAGYGGEEWRGLGEGIDRIERLTKRKVGETRSTLEKSRKRPIEEKLSNTGSVSEIGQGFQKRLKALDGRRRDRGRR